MGNVLKSLIGTACVVVIAAGCAKAYGAYQDNAARADKESALRYELTVYARGEAPSAYCEKMPRVLASAALDENFRPTFERLSGICKHFGYL